MIEPEKTSESDQPQETSLSQESVRSVHANLVRMHQSAAEILRADEVGLQQSAAGSVEATSVTAHQSALGFVEAEEVLSQRSAIGNVQAEKASVMGYTGSVVARNAEVHYGITGVFLVEVIVVNVC